MASYYTVVQATVATRRDGFLLTYRRECGSLLADRALIKPWKAIDRVRIERRSFFKFKLEKFTGIRAESRTILFLVE
jgi:hypothetical protein